MKAIVYSRFGGPEALELRDMPEPQPRENELLIRVHAAGLNPVDWKLLRGEFRFMARGPWPRRAGMEFAGRVIAVGSRVLRFKVGDAVHGALDPFKSPNGCFAEIVCARESEAASIRDGLSFSEAAVLHGAGISALDCLRRLGEARAGQRVLIIGASGGIGTFAIQVAKLWGLHVTAVCRESAIDLVRQLGADAVVAFDLVDPLRLGERFDLIVDAAAKYHFSDCAALLTDRGIYVNSMPGPRTFFDALRTRIVGRRRARFLMVQVNQDSIAEIGRLAAERKIKAIIGHTFPLAQARAAYELSLAGHVRGKIVIKVLDDEISTKRA
jgi:NADPH:quinone reductase-like Zn-dependent oxidoreductase